MSKKSYFVLLFFLIILQSTITAQVDSCEISLAFYTSDIYTFPASTNTTAQSGPDYGCLSSQPNPAWYHMKIALAGDLEITMTSTPSKDIDFICWRPFPDASFIDSYVSYLHAAVIFISFDFLLMQ